MGGISLTCFREIANVNVGDPSQDLIVDIQRGKNQDKLVARKITEVENSSGNGKYVRNAFYNSIVSSLRASGTGDNERLLDQLRVKLGMTGASRNAPEPKSLKMRVIKECLDMVDSHTTSNLYADRMSAASDQEDVFLDDFVVIAHGDDSVYENHNEKEFRDILDKLNTGSDVRMTRNRLFIALRARFPAVDASIYQKLDLKGLRQLCADLVANPRMNEQALRDEVENLAQAGKAVNTNELLDAMDRVEIDPAYANKVTFQNPKPPETGVNALLADLAFDQDATLCDNSATPELRLLKTLRKHASTLALVCASPKSPMLAAQLPVAALPILGKIVELTKNVFGLRPAAQPEGGGGFLSWLGRAMTGKTDTQQFLGQLKAKLDAAEEQLARGETPELLTRYNEGVDAIVTEQCDAFQNVMAKAFNAIISKQPLNTADFIHDLGGEEIARACGEIFHQEIDLPQRPANEAPNVRPEAGRRLATRDQILQFGTRNQRPVLVAEMNAGFAELAVDEKVRRLGVLFEGFLASMHATAEVKRECREYFFRWMDLVKAGEAPMPTAIDLNIQNVFLDEIAAHVAPDFANKLAYQVPEGAPEYPNGWRELPLEEVELLSDEDREEYERGRIEALPLDELAGKGALDPTSGYGKFVKELMTRYFHDSDPIDRRAMFASMIRNAPPISSMLGKEGEQRDLSKDDIASQTLGAFLKGAGPVMQKTLQQLSSLDVPKVFKDALADMRSDLLPLPDKVVHALLADLVDQSNGEIAHLEVVKSLGAASVAQSLLCRLTDASGNTRDVVVKLIRPEAENRAKREAQLCLTVAQDIGEGMAASMKGRIDRIMEEFDLTIEAANAEAGAVYNSPGELHDRTQEHIFTIAHTEAFNDIRSVKIDALNPKSRSAIIMELAPGETTDRILKLADKELAQLQKDYLDGGRVRGATPEERRQNFLAFQGRLVEIHDRIRRVQLQTVHFAHLWVVNGIYGNGFFHGDAHAGNSLAAHIFTVIDYGNATRLTESQQDAVLQVLGSCMLPNTDGAMTVSYMEAFRSLLSPAGRAEFDRQRDNVSARISAILAKGDMQSAGKIISATLMELQKLGIEIPPPVFNFSQSQLLIQGTIDQLNATLANVRAKMRDVTESAIDDIGDLSAEDVRPLAESYSLANDARIDDMVRDFLLHQAALPGYFAHFEAVMGPMAQDNPQLKAAYDELVQNPAYVARKNRFEDQRLVGLYREADNYDFVHYDDLRDDPQYVETQLEHKRRNLEMARRYHLPQAEETAREVAVLEMVLRLRTERDQLRSEIEEREARLEQPLDDAGLDAAKARFAEVLEGSRQQFYRQLQTVFDRQTVKTAPGEADRSFLTVMANALFDNKFKTAWSLGLKGTVRMIKAIVANS